MLAEVRIGLHSADEAAKLSNRTTTYYTYYTYEQRATSILAIASMHWLYQSPCQWQDKKPKVCHWRCFDFGKHGQDASGALDAKKDTLLATEKGYKVAAVWVGFLLGNITASGSPTCMRLKGRFS